ncbi:hypothetical protein GUJ93_ZPchr0010g9355 [Zizania palustris]|uniref:F-box protein n=1 Tax=Zizania palustris TaxID=103762 RepID=A0A8J6BHW1_ZIZPA|nr:hypothetical protein GUJ93_ZPchr0010g9355 [Zizania palustris]
MALMSYARKRRCIHRSEATTTPLEWEALRLVGPLLDAESLAAASCVSTTWRDVYSDDYLWAQLCRSRYPSALALLPLPDNGGDDASDRHSSPHRHLFALFRSASARRRALLPPRLALDDVTFAVDIFAASGSNTLSFTVTARDADAKTSRFQFEVDLSGRNVAVGQVNYWSVRWTAVQTGIIGVAPAAVVMLDAKAPAARAFARGIGERGETWARETLPAHGCGGAVVGAEVVFDMSAGEERLLEKVRLGLIEHTRYVSIDDGLRYLQHFLL